MDHAELVATFVAATPGCTPDEAAVLFSDICTAWTVDPERFPRLVELVASESGLGPALVVATLHGMAALERCVAGGELLFAMGLRVAHRRGVTMELLDRLVTLEESRRARAH